MININDEIKRTIIEFEHHNNIEIGWYHSNPPGMAHVWEDSRIGKDVFEKRIGEWLSVCSTDEEKELLLKLLASFDYYPQDVYKIYLNRLLDSYFKMIGFNLENDNIKDVLFLAVPSKDMKLSGATHISSLIACHLLDYGAKSQIIENFLCEQELQYRINECKHIAIIDDIVGSGHTINTAVESLFKMYSIKSGIDITILLMCGREKKIKSKVKGFEKRYPGFKFNCIVQKQIYKCNKGENPVVTADELAIIENLEMQIEKAAPPSANTYILGFERNSLLVSFFYNTPNNSLSTFWRPSTNNIPLFTRADKPRRPSVSELKDATEKNTKNAYRNNCKS